MNSCFRTYSATFFPLSLCDLYQGEVRAKSFQQDDDVFKEQRLLIESHSWKEPWQPVLGAASSGEITFGFAGMSRARVPGGWEEERGVRRSVTSSSRRHHHTHAHTHSDELISITQLVLTPSAWQLVPNLEQIVPGSSFHTLLWE